MKLYLYLALVSLTLFVLQDHLASAKRGGGGSFSLGKKPGKTKWGGSSKTGHGTHTQAGNYPRQPQSPNQNPAGGYPAGGGYPNQYPGRAGVNPGGYPAGGGYPNQYPGGAGVNPGGYPAGGGYPNQYPGRAGVNPGGYPAGGGYPNQYPGGAGVNPGGYPAGGGYPNQYPGRAGINPGLNPGGYPNQYGGGAFPGGAAYPGGYPNRASPGWGQQGAFPGGYPAGGGGYPNWNPNNPILSPRYGGGYGYGGAGYGMGGSPFSRSVNSMGMGPSLKSKGFGKNAALAAGVGAVAGMAVGYGLGRFPRPNFHFHSPMEEYYYNRYMYRRYGTASTDTNDYGRDYKFNPPQSYDDFMDACMKRIDLLQGQDVQSSPEEHEELPAGPVHQDIGSENGTMPSAGERHNRTAAEEPVGPASSKEKEDDDTVSILEIGYPELIEQLKARRCVELYAAYSERYMEKQTDMRSSERVGVSGGAEPQHPLSLGLALLLSSSALLLGIPPALP